jgi:hypothetical protein
MLTLDAEAIAAWIADSVPTEKASVRKWKFPGLSGVQRESSCWFEATI